MARNISISSNREEKIINCTTSDFNPEYLSIILKSLAALIINII